MPRKSQTNTPAADVIEAAEAAARQAEDEREHRAWCLRVINAMQLNLTCPSRTCRRNGCQDVRRCEGGFRNELTLLFAKFARAQLAENSSRKEIRNAPDVGRRKALPAYGRKRGILPLREFRDDEPEPAETGRTS